jgi:putative ABC transport system permease protein
MKIENGNRKLGTGKSKLENRVSRFVKPDSSAEPQASNSEFRVPNFQFPVSRFQFRIWLRALTVKRPQAAVTVGSLLVGAMVASTLINLYSDVQRKMTYEFAAYGPNVVLAPAYAAEPGQGVGSIYGTETHQSEWWANLMDQSILSRLEPANRNDGQRVTEMAAAPLLYLVVRVDRAATGKGDNEGQPTSVDNAVAVGTDFAALRRLNPNWHVQGPAETLETCALGTRLAARLHVGLGDAIRLQTLERTASEAPETWRVFPISSVVATGAVEDDQVFVPLAALQKLAGLAGKISLVQLSIPGPPTEIERRMSELSRRLPGLQVRPVRQIVYSEGRVLGALRTLLISLTAIIVVIIGLCVMATIISIVLERRRDVAVMKALGASDRRIMQLFLSEVATLGLAGGVTGMILGVLLARDFGRRLFGVNLTVTAWTLPTVVLAAVLLALLASLVPLRLVRSIQPATILKGE